MSALFASPRRFGEQNFGDRVPPIVAIGRQLSSDAVETAVYVDVSLSRPGLFVAGRVAARWARNVRAKLVVLLRTCVPVQALWGRPAISIAFGLGRMRENLLALYLVWGWVWWQF